MYSNGAQVLGSGTGDDPYILEKAPIQSIVDSNGNQLIPDSNRAVTLPTVVSRIISSDTGVEYFPDSQGRVFLPTDALAGMSFIDPSGTILTVGTGDVIKILLDGDDGNFTGNPTVEIDPSLKTIRFPNMKVYEGEATSVPIAIPDTQGNVSAFTDLMPIVMPMQAFYGNSATHTMNISLQLSYDGAPFEAPGNDWARFSMRILFSNGTTWIDVTEKIYFGGDKSQCYHDYYFFSSLASVPGSYTLQLELKENYLASADRRASIKADVKVAGVWI